MVARLRRRVLTPTIVPIGVILATAALIVLVGEALLAFVNPDAGGELERPELWVALAATLAIIGAGSFLATRPQGSVGLLEREVVIGRRPFFAPEPPPVAAVDRLRRGPVGTLADIREGDTIHARSGPLARVLGVLPGDQDYGRQRRGFLFATGLYGASNELWIPVEAVLAVYPETRSVFLAIKGDETEHYGWNRAPEGFRRAPHASHFPSAH